MLKSKTKVSDNRVAKQAKVKVKGDCYIVAINYKLSWGKSNSKFYFRQLVISSDTPIYSFSDSRILRSDIRNSFFNLRLLT